MSLGSPPLPHAQHALLESPRQALHTAVGLQRERFVTFALQGGMQIVRARLPARPAHQENTIQRLAQATQHLVFNVLKAPLVPPAPRLATSAQQDGTQQQARHFANSVMLVTTQAIQHRVFSVLKAPLAPQARPATSAQQDGIQQQARHPAKSVMLVNILLHFLQYVRVVMVDTTQKSHRQVARCVRLEHSVTQRHPLDVSSAHQDTTQLLAQRVALPARD